MTTLFPEMNDDYVTVEQTMIPGESIVVVMKWSNPLDSYLQTKCSRRMKHEAAVALAKSWGAALKLEVR